MQIYQKFKTSLKRRDTLVAFFVLCLSISVLSFQFGRTQLSNEGNPSFVEQDKIIYPILAGLLTLVAPFLINAYMDQQLQQEVEKAIKDVLEKETSDGIRARQEIEFVASFVTKDYQSIDSLINSNALLTTVQEKLRQPKSKEQLVEIQQDENERHELVAILLSKSDNDNEVAEILARTATLVFFNITQDEMSNNRKANTFCKDLYKCLRAWLVCSLRKGRCMPVEVLKLSYPNETTNYEYAIRLIYEDIIHRESAKKYFKTEASKRTMKKYLELLISRLHYLNS